MNDDIKGAIARGFWSVSLVVIPLPQIRAQPESDSSPVNKGRTTQIAKVTPEFPAELRNTPHYRGFAKVVFMVDEAGQSYDFILLESTHPRFGENALEGLKKWRVTPPIVDGEPRPTRHTVKVEFSQKGPVLIERALGEIDNEVAEVPDSSLHFRISELADLDRLPRRIETAVANLPESLSKDEATGIVRIEFFIDEEGRVRAPGVLFSTNDGLEDSAVTTVSNWRFEPPSRAGNPVMVRAVQTIRFKMARRPNSSKG